MKQQLYIKKGNRYLPIDNKLSQYEEDCIWKEVLCDFKKEMEE